MLWRSTLVPLILAYQSSHQIASVLAFSKAPIAVAAERFQRRASGTTQEARNDTANMEQKSMSSDTQQLFGRFEISSNQIFHISTFSFAMVNLRPIVPGHVLVCSTRVTPLLSDLEDDEYDDLWRAVRVVEKVLKQQYKCDAFNVAVQDGAGAGQSVSHVHVHILPRYCGDLERNDDVYDQLEAWAPRDDVSKNKAKLDVPADSERRDRTVEEMKNEATIYRSLIDHTS